MLKISSVIKMAISEDSPFADPELFRWWFRLPYHVKDAQNMLNADDIIDFERRVREISIKTGEIADGFAAMIEKKYPPQISA